MIVLVITVLVVAVLAVDFVAHVRRENARNQIARDVRRTWEARQHLDIPCAVCGAAVGQWCDAGVHHG